MAGAPSLAAEQRRHVLIIYSYDDLLPWQALIRSGLQERLEQIEPASRPDIYEERVDAARIDPAQSGPAFVAYLKAKYAGLTFDAVITESSAATRIVLANPALFAPAPRFAIDPAVAAPAVPDAATHVIVTQGDWARQSLLTVAAVMPAMTRLIAVVDHSPVGEAAKRKLLAAASALPAAAALEVWDDFTFDELFARSARLPPDTALFFSPVFRDRDRARRTPRVVAQRLAGASTAPVFAYHDTFLGTGVVGGRLLSSRRVGAMIADLALGPGYAERWAEPEALLNPFIFDDAALRRWNIAATRLPPSSLIVGGEESVWRRYGWQIGTAVAALVLEGLLIIGLITALRLRRAAVREVVRERDGLERRVAERTRDLLAATRGLEETNARLKALAGTDALTGIANRRRFLEVAESALGRARREATPLSFLMLDIDRFKSVNDRHGHAAGDAVIRAVADLCQGHGGPPGCVGRLGGEEFAILLYGVDACDALARAERIRHAAGALPVDIGSGTRLGVTVSVGVSALRPGHDPLNDMMARADAALYRAKTQGRDRVATDGSAGGRTLPAVEA